MIIIKEWIEEEEFNDSIIEIYHDSWALLCTIGDATPQEIFYDPKELMSFSCKHLKWIDGQMMESNEIFHVVFLKMGRNKVFLDFHIFDIPEGDNSSWLVRL